MKTINKLTTGTCTFQLPVLRVRECWALKSDFFEPSTPGCTGTAWIWINNKFYNINYHGMYIILYKLILKRLTL